MSDKSHPDVEQAKAQLHQRIDNDFTYRPPTSAQIHLYGRVREEARMYAHTLVDSCPVGRELSLALTHLEAAVLMANAAIARNGGT